MSQLKNGRIYYTPDELGYHDRGKMKWMGMMLSDHTEALQQLKDDAKSQSQKTYYEPMDTKDIAQVLNDSYTYQKPILIQANLVNNGNFYDHLPCIVMGSKENYIYLKKIDGSESKCQLEDIRHVKWMDPLDWYNKQESSHLPNRG